MDNVAQKSNWAERANAGVVKTAEFMKEHGTNIGLAGGSVLLAMGVGAEGMAVMYQDAGSAVDVYREGAAALVTAGMLKIGAFAGAELAARKFLDVSDNYFDDSSYRKAAYDVDGDPIYVDPRSSAPIETVSDEEIMDAQLKEAIVDVLEECQNNPKLTEAVSTMLKEAPQEARDALFQAQQEVKQNRQASSVENIDYSNTDLPDQDDSPGM